MSDPLTAQLKIMIVETLALDDAAPDDIPDDEPLIGTPRLGLDSIDMLELVIRLEKEFGIKIGSSEESAWRGVSWRHSCRHCLGSCR
jgi:acyl carrier protein